MIRWAALCIHGAASLSGVDAYIWQQLCSSFDSASVTLCDGLAVVACHLCVDDVDSAELTGVQPVRVNDVPWRIIAKAILHVIGNDIQLSAS